MQFTFMDMAGKTLFIRDDAEKAEWVQEEMTLEMEFPRFSDKVISIGQRVFFKDPATGAHQIYEVKTARTLEPDHYQTVTAENICISELSDEHMDNKEVTNKSASSVLSSVLSDTLWSVGAKQINPTSSADLSRGSVWQAILEIKDNWNVYIEPHLTIHSDGTITRKLDIIDPDGEWNGVRLSINKNLLDPSVTFDDSEVVTAMYGYGGTTTPTSASEEPVEINFSNVVWSKTSAHPAKPRGQKYIEDPTATANYGRNGRARFGYYQNTAIDDPDLLLEKTWETLQTCSKPAISIEGTVADLYRMGYADQPIKLHDIALVEVNPAGYKQQIQIIRMTTDLLNPTATRLTIGSFIPNIIYIDRKTNESATGVRGGGGGGSNRSGQSQRQEFATEFIKTDKMIGLRAYQLDLDRVDEQVIKNEAQILVESDRITAEVTARRSGDQTLNSRITQTATEINMEVSKKVGKNEVISCINQTAESIKIKASLITLDGSAVADSLDGQEIYCDVLGADDINIASDATINRIDCGSIKVDDTSASWQSKTVVTSITLGDSKAFVYKSSGQEYTMLGKLVEGTPLTSTIHYLGY